jgi:hypothetical protein
MLRRIAAGAAHAKHERWPTEMKTETTQETALRNESIAESSMAFVILSAGILIGVFAVSALIWLAFLDNGRSGQETRQRDYFFIVFGLWVLLSILLWRVMLSGMRRTPNLDLSEDGFFKFQIASAFFVLAFWVLLRISSINVPEYISALRVVFEVLLLLFTIAYLSFAWGTKKAVPLKIYLGLLINVGVLATAKLG